MSDIVLVTDRILAITQSTEIRSGKIVSGIPVVVSTSESEITPASGTPATPAAATRQSKAVSIC